MFSINYLRNFDLSC